MVNPCKPPHICKLHLDKQQKSFSPTDVTISKIRPSKRFYPHTFPR